MSAAYVEKMAHSCAKEKTVALVKHKFNFMFQHTGGNGKTISFKLKMQMQTCRHTLETRIKRERGYDRWLESQNKSSFSDLSSM